MTDDETLEMWSPGGRPTLGRNKVLEFARRVIAAEREVWNDSDIKHRAEIEKLQTEAKSWRAIIDAAQQASHDAGLIGMIGSPAWIGQLKNINADAIGKT